MLTIVVPRFAIFFPEDVEGVEQPHGEIHKGQEHHQVTSCEGAGISFKVSINGQGN